MSGEQTTSAITWMILWCFIAVTLPITVPALALAWLMSKWWEARKSR